MKYIFILMLLFSSNTFASTYTSLDDSYKWTFIKSGTSNEVPVIVGRSLIDQFWRGSCCNGTYKLSLNSKNLQQFDSNQPVGLYIPAIGALSEVKIGTQPSVSYNEDFSSVGPIIPISKNELQNPKIEILIKTHGPITNLTGIWKTPPQIGLINTLIENKENDYKFQQVFPTINFIILFVFSITFLLIHFSIGKKNPVYFHFAQCLFLWAVFYLFLAGHFRSINFFLASALHYPIRIMASYGLLLLINRAVNRSHNSTLAFGYFSFFAILNLVFGLMELPILQTVSLSVVALVSFMPLRYLKWKDADSIGKVLVIFGVIALVGQSLDAFKLVASSVNISYPFPYVNRWTFLPLMLVSFGDCIIQFSGSFHQLRTHLFKAKSYARTILHSAKVGLSHDNVNYFLKVTSKICGFNRVSLSQRQEDGSYRVIKLYGSNFSAEGATVDLEKSADIKLATTAGHVVFGSVKGVSEGWCTSEFAAVPVPEEKCPPYLMLLSDPKKTNLSSKDVLPYLSQISSALWTNLERTKEQTLRVQTEKKFSSLVQKLDPSLYEFITSNINKIDDADEMISSTRGIVFFDQKAYSTMTEDFDDENMGKFARLVGEWVTNSAARYGSRISNFAGDAFLLETFSIGSESEASIAERTLNLVWNLAQTMGELNQILLKEGFTPVTFRFGAHIGNVAAANLDFIQKGLSNSIGDTVNVTARLQSLAKAGSIYISGELAQYAFDKFITTPVPKQYVKGRLKKIEIFSLVGKVDIEVYEEKKVG